MKAWIIPHKEGTILKLYVQPGASKNEFSGFYGEPSRIKLRIKSLPVEGKANKAVIEFMAKNLSIRKSQIEIIRGQQSRLKDLFIAEATIVLDRKLQVQLE